ncbi:MAG: peptidylprolyl isomerase [Anaerolineae bacterium]|nr:MAG: peptidylprolyl isomerase [Anaerolineae bacterium]
MSDPKTVQDGQVVSMEYTLRVDGEVIDSSEGHEPFEYIQGAGNIIPGLEREMYGMAIGESKEVTIAAKDGYGEVDEEAFIDVPRDRFPPSIPLKEGVELQVSDQSGRPMYARIHEVGDETVRLDFNHPLAGKELHFSVKVVGLRDATDEEMAHRHVHPQE